MKKKLLSLCCLAGGIAMLGAALGAGLVVRQAAGPKTEVVNAAAGEKLAGYYVVGDAITAGWTNNPSSDYQFTEQADGTFQWSGVFTTNNFRVIAGGGSWDTKLGWSKIDSSSAKVADNTFTAWTSDDNIHCNTAGTYILTIDSGKTKLSITAPAGNYEVTEYSVLDGVKSTEPIRTESSTSGVVFTPAAYIKSGYKVTGWYTDEGLTSAYTPAVVTAKMTIYGKLESANDSELYFLTGTDNVKWTKTYVYAYGGASQFGAWPGTELTKCTTSMNFKQSATPDDNTQGGIWTVPYCTTVGDNMVIFNDGGTTVSGSTKQTGDLKLTDKALYLKSDVTDNTGDVWAGAAAKVCISIENEILATTHKTLCEIDKVSALLLTSQYDLLTDEQEAYVNRSTEYQFKDNKYVDKEDFAFNLMIAQLRIIGEQGSAIAISSDDVNRVLYISVGVVSLSLILLGTTFVVRHHKKHEND